MQISKINLNLIYSSPLGSYRFGDKNFSLYNDDISPENFETCLGGLELIANRHFIFFQLLQYDELLKFVHFLIRFLIKESSPENIRNHFIYDEYRLDLEKAVTALKFPEETLSFCNLGSLIKISFLPANTITDLSESLYFDNIYVDARLMENATVKALDKYFQVASRIVDNTDDTYLYQLINFWNELKSLHY